MTVQELSKILGKNIKNHRTAHGWSQEDLAEKIDVSINTISEIETGRKFARAETLINFAAVFETEVYELLKPENILPDDRIGLIAKYSLETITALEKIKDEYMNKINLSE